MSLHHTTQLFGSIEAIRFRKNRALPDTLFCVVDEHLTIEAKHIRALAAALDAYEAQEAAEVAA